jgi:glyoxylase-like metal-dependent hydrolase (beta-lactamase superfamily II)
MPAKLIKLTVGPWPMNAYIVADERTGIGAIIDPGADPEVFLEAAKDLQIEKILITHGHMDHVGALEEVKNALNVPVLLHPDDADKFSLDYDNPLNDGDEIELGDITLKVVHTPGHTEGQCCFIIDHGVIVGDTIFVGGPGKTWSSEEFALTMDTMQNIVFRWSDETEFYPGHGPSGKIGIERPSFESFLSRGWSEDTHGDVTWVEQD